MFCVFVWYLILVSTLACSESSRIGYLRSKYPISMAQSRNIRKWTLGPRMPLPRPWLKTYALASQ